jgi:hypothetical protein
MAHAGMCVPVGHLCRPIFQEFPDRVQIHPGHYQSTGEGMSVAMPGIVLERRTLDGAQEPAVRGLRIWEDEIAIVLDRKFTVRALPGVGQ